MTAIAIKARNAGRRRYLRAVSDAGLTAESRLDPYWAPLVIRVAVAADAPGLRRLAHLDSARTLTGPKLLAEQSGLLVAALSLEDGVAVADPFAATADAVALLRLRAAQLNRETPAA